jgi:hypothetical protein
MRLALRLVKVAQRAMKKLTLRARLRETLDSSIDCALIALNEDPEDTQWSCRRRMRQGRSLLRRLMTPHIHGALKAVHMENDPVWSALEAVRAAHSLWPLPAFEALQEQLDAMMRI